LGERFGTPNLLLLERRGNAQRPWLVAEAVRGELAKVMQKT
jgi:hypothetical protein